MIDANKSANVRTSLSRRMKIRMFELDLTMRDLAKKCGVNERSIGGYVAMHNMMGADTLAAIADGLECSADWLLGLKEERQ